MIYLFVLYFPVYFLFDKATWGIRFVEQNRPVRVPARRFGRVFTQFSHSFHMVGMRWEGNVPIVATMCAKFVFSVCAAGMFLGLILIDLN